ncbi:MAG: hypothetical protein QF645_02720 [Planctomycetota bacterium]|nr:hypothetical protein [Planctomycetota bacterium]
MKQMTSKSTLWLLATLLSSLLYGCGGSDSGSQTDNTVTPPPHNIPDHAIYVLRSPYFVTTDGDTSNPVQNYDLNSLQDYLNWEYDKLSYGLLDYIYIDATKKLDFIDCPVVLANGYAETIIHALPGEVLTLSEIDALRSELLGQYADGWGEGIEQMYFSTTNTGEELYVSLYGGMNWSIDLYGKYSYETDPGTGDVIVTPLLP